MEGNGVVVARAGRFVVFRRPLEEDAQRARATAPGGGNARGQAVPGGSAHDQHIARKPARSRRNAAGNLGDLTLDVAATAFRMSVDTNKAARAALDDLFGHEI